MRNFLYLAAGVVLVAVNLMSLTNSLSTTTSFFTSSRPVQDNVFSTGQLDLKLSDGDETSHDSVLATWTHGAMRPGDIVAATLSISNAGSLAASYVDVVMASTVTEAASAPGNVSSVPLDTVLEVVELRYDGEDALYLVNDANGNSIRDLADLASSGLTGLSLTNLGADHALEMTVLFNPDLAGNQHHDDMVVTHVTVTLVLDPS